MMQRTYAVIIIALGVLSHATANAEWITSWGDGVQGVDYDISQSTASVSILRGNDSHYKFYSETAQGNGVPGVINRIEVDHDATGNFTLTIDDPNSDPNIPAPRTGSAGICDGTMARNAVNHLWLLKGVSSKKTRPF